MFDSGVDCSSQMSDSTRRRADPLAEATADLPSEVREKPVNFTRFVDRPPGDEVGDMGSGLRKCRQIFVATRPKTRIILLHNEL